MVAHWFQAAFAVIGSSAILQSLTLKWAGTKVVDLGPLIEKFRQRVFDSIGRTAIDNKRQRGLKLVSQLSKKYAGMEPELRDELSTVLNLLLGDKQAAAQELVEIQPHCRANNLLEVRGYSERLVVMDMARAETLVRQL